LKARLFCSGHCFLADGNLVVGGGHRFPVDNNVWARGMLFSYIFNPVNENWNYEGISPNHIRMQDGRWYPTLTLYTIISFQSVRFFIILEYGC